MLRLPRYTYHRPATLDDALELLAEFGSDVMPIAGGTDLVPNMKHRLFTPGHLVSLRSVTELKGIREEDGGLRIGAGETIHALAEDGRIRERYPSLAKACSLISGPQLRRMGTLGGNICLDTRCVYYNQTLAWRKALGYCLKKDGDVCHVVRGGTRCVAAHSADTPPVLMTLGAVVEIAGPGGRRELPIEELFTSDGVSNRRMEAGEIVVSVFLPPPPPAARFEFEKLRLRAAIDYPLLNLAVALEVDGRRRVTRLEIVASGLGSYPRRIGKLREAAVGRPLGVESIQAVADEAFRQCHPLDNIAVDAEWRRAMVPVLVKRALERLAEE